MADTKTTALTELTSTATTDILVIVDDPGGTPVTKKITVANLLKDLPTDAIDALTEIASGLKSGSDATLVTGTAGDAGDILIWDANGDAVASAWIESSGNWTAGGTLDMNDKALFGHLASITTDATTAYTLVIGDSGKVITMTSGSANVVTIPTNASVAFAVGTQIGIIQTGAGATSVTGDTGVTVNGTSAGSGTISAQYGGVALLKTATDTWILTGDHGGVS